jgi:ParB-like chromosome segregation protein Spo0J
VEVALGPNPAFLTGRVGAFTRRVPADRVVTGAPPRRGRSNPPREPRPPSVVEVLRKAQGWRALLDSGQAANQAEIARREGVTRARVTQVMSLLRLTREIHEHILSMPKTVHRSTLTELALRPVARLKDRDAQIAAFRALARETE